MAMPEFFLRCAILLALMALPSFASAEEQEIRRCDFELKRRCIAGYATVTLARGTLARLEALVIWCGPGGHRKSLDYSCAIDSSRDDKASAWSQDAGATVIANGSPWNPDEPDRVKVTVGRDVSIDFDEAQSLGRCGAGAELPRAIVIPAHKAACRVWLRTP
jgi:hypothetical protein